jgi:hypothetical protein
VPDSRKKHGFGSSNVGWTNKVNHIQHYFFIADENYDNIIGMGCNQ